MTTRSFRSKRSLPPGIMSLAQILGRPKLYAEEPQCQARRSADPKGSLLTLLHSSWPGLSRPSRLLWHGLATAGGVTGTTLAALAARAVTTKYAHPLGSRA